MVPSVVNILPARAPVGGRAFVQIYGDGFRLPVIVPNPTGATPALAPTVEVLFDDEPGLNARVVRSNRIFVQAPPSPLSGAIVRVQGVPNMTFADADPDTITRDAGSWLDDGFRPGQLVRVARSDSNDGKYTLADVSDLVLTLGASDSLTAEGPTAGVVVETRAHGEGIVDVTVRNLDDNGDPIVGEEVVVADAFTYRRVQLATEAGLTRMLRQFIREWRRQVLPNTVYSMHTEYDAETGDALNVTELATLPGIALVGPRVAENRFYSLNGIIEVELPSGEVLMVPAPYTVDLAFSVTGVSDSKVELLNLLTAATQFVDGNSYIYLDRDPDDASQGQVRYEFDFAPGGDFEVGGGGNTSNLRSFGGTVVVRGFDIEDIAGFAGASGVGLTVPVSDLQAGLDAVAVGVTMEQLGETYDVGPSPGGKS